ncbi:Uncharacterised protein [Suttonella ornithocola]|uniref:Uncharacterized protein n=1 Tax=Suttonella ornithocola TaxID=279832 RepID=A0A380MQM2_9GAMM|nr:Uncharacterised protein [Suttonella ornithocola]
MISDEISEVYYHCDRVFIMKEGRLDNGISPQEISLANLEERVYD